MKNRIVLPFFCVLLCGVMVQTFVTWADDATDSDTDVDKGLCGVVSLDQYISLAKLVYKNESKGEAVATAITRTVEKAETREQKLVVLSEITVSLMAVAQKANAQIDGQEIVRAILKTALEIPMKQKDAKLEDQITFGKWAFAAIALVDPNLEKALPVAMDVIPESIHDELLHVALETQTSVMGGEIAWVDRALYKTVLLALYEDGVYPEEIIREGVPVFLTTTTTTTTSTTTTTTSTIPGSHRVHPSPPTTTRPITIPTTRPSPTPVGNR